jgi:hypothetical protein
LMLLIAINITRTGLTVDGHAGYAKTGIEDGICFDIHMNVEGLAPDWTIPEAVRKVTGYKEICLKCPNHRED